MQISFSHTGISPFLFWRGFVPGFTLRVGPKPKKKRGNAEVRREISVGAQEKGRGGEKRVVGFTVKMVGHPRCGIAPSLAAFAQPILSTVQGPGPSISNALPAKPSVSRFVLPRALSPRRPFAPPPNDASLIPVLRLSAVRGAPNHRFSDTPQ
jgi:hypothetical protein